MLRALSASTASTVCACYRLGLVRATTDGVASSAIPWSAAAPFARQTQRRAVHIILTRLPLSDAVVAAARPVGGQAAPVAGSAVLLTALRARGFATRDADVPSNAAE